ncbi:MAG TPA: DUF1643 domain-containing protein [Chloroflexia bacterium]|nr:DUF1643 domain-containing protein [Chloroflexia bacterium]
MAELAFRQVARCVPEISDEHRYLLEIKLLESEVSRPRLAVILKNPSTAGAQRSDPTVGKVESWARKQGFASVIYVNLFALRSTKPAPLNHYSYEQAVGPENDYFIRQALEQADTIVAAWGNSNGIDPARYRQRIQEVLVLAGAVRLKVVGPLTRQGSPRHGLLWNNEPVLADYLI